MQCAGASAADADVRRQHPRRSPADGEAQGDEAHSPSECQAKEDELQRRGQLNWQGVQHTGELQDAPGGFSCAKPARSRVVSNTVSAGDRI